MPYSDGAFDLSIKTYLQQWAFQSYLDIGAGSGKYGRMIREIAPQAHIIGVEVWQHYIEQFKLRDVYSTIVADSISNFYTSRPDFTTDVAIIGDCIEHLWKSEGTNLLHYLMYRSKKIIVIFPDKYVQYSYQGNPHEAHNSVWSQQDFSQFEHEFYACGFMRMAIITGYL